MTTIIDDPEAKPWWQSVTNLSAIVAAVTIFAPQKYKDLVGPTAETAVQIASLLAVGIGRWRAGGVKVPLLGAKQK